ncbi:MAG: hypothetical protein AMXMBFR33_61700 [Candidatus Xenobia bacterium]
MKTTTWIWFALCLWLPSWSESPPREVVVSTLPPGCQVRVLSQPPVTLQEGRPGSVLLPLSLARGTLKLELSRPGYEPLGVEVDSRRLLEEGRLPLEEHSFYRLRPRLLKVTFQSQPGGATVLWQDQALGTTGAPLELNLASMAELRRRQDPVRFTLTLPGYRSASLDVTLEELEKGALPPVKLQPAFPGAGLVSWLSRHVTLAWAALGIVLIGMVVLLRRIRTPASR